MSRFDRIDPALDDDYCDGLSDDERCPDCGATFSEAHALDCAYTDEDFEDNDTDEVSA